MKSFFSVIASGLALLAASPVSAIAQDRAELVQAVIDNAPDDAWRSLDPDNTLYLDIEAGRMIIELMPEFAPRHVARMRAYAREYFYDGIIFHRVIDGVIAQGGDPLGNGTGGSDKPNLQSEFMLAATPEHKILSLGRDQRTDQVGFFRSLPAASELEMTRVLRADKLLPTWGLHCPGVMSMARTDDPNSANSQFFLLLGDARGSLDLRYSVWGKIVHGFEHAATIARGSPPATPTVIQSVRLASELPSSEREDIQVMRIDSVAFQRILEINDAVVDGRVIDICAVDIPSRIVGDESGA